MAIFNSYVCLPEGITTIRFKLIYSKNAGDQLGVQPHLSGACELHCTIGQIPTQVVAVKPSWNLLKLLKPMSIRAKHPEILPSGKRLHNYGKSPFWMWMFPFKMEDLSIATLVITRGYPGSSPPRRFTKPPAGARAHHLHQLLQRQLGSGRKGQQLGRGRAADVVQTSLTKPMCFTVVNPENMVDNHG